MYLPRTVRLSPEHTARVPKVRLGGVLRLGGVIVLCSRDYVNSCFARNALNVQPIS